MADRPQSTTTLVETGGSVGIDVDLLCIMSCTQSGTAAQVAKYTRAGDIVSTFGKGEGCELAPMFVDGTGKSVAFCKLTTVTAGAIGNVDTKGVTGTSVITFTSLSSGPYDDEEIFVDCLLGGTIATGPIEIRYSRDGGVTWSGRIRLGTANFYDIVEAGIKVNFGAGTLVANDRAKVYCKAPRWDAAGLAAGFAALAASNLLPRAILVCGDVTLITEVQSVIDVINSYETSNKRAARVVFAARDFQQPAQMQGTQTMSAQNPAMTYTRSAGNFTTDGFKVGMTIIVTGMTQAANNGPKTVTAVGTTTITVSDTLAAEAGPTSNVTITGTEGKVYWKTQVEAIVGATPQTQKIGHRALITGGRARHVSLVDNKTRKRRPLSWAFIIRAFQHDVHISPAKVEDKELDGWSISDLSQLPGLTTTNAVPDVAEYDERVDGGLLGMRVTSLTTQDDMPGVFISLAVTLDTDNLPLSRWQIGAVCDVAYSVVQRETTLRLNGEVDLYPTTGFIRESEAKRIEGYILTRLTAALLSPRAEGRRASAVTFTIARDVDLRQAGAAVPTTTIVTGKGYIEKFTNIIRVAGAGG